MISARVINYITIKMVFGDYKTLIFLFIPKPISSPCFIFSVAAVRPRLLLLAGDELLLRELLLKLRIGALGGKCHGAVDRTDGFSDKS